MTKLLLLMAIAPGVIDNDLLGSVPKPRPEKYDPYAPPRTKVGNVVSRTKSAVVAIYIHGTVTGAGVLVSPRGHIVTSCHVIGRTRNPTVILHDKSRHVAEVVFSEARWDLACLRIKGDSLPYVDLGSAGLGEQVVVIGHPLGFEGTVTTGIVSAMNRSIESPTGDVLSGLLQTDASINPGNSGGPVLNLNGELAGIVCAYREGAQGISFAVSAKTVKYALEKMGVLLSPVAPQLLMTPMPSATAQVFRQRGRSTGGNC